LSHRLVTQVEEEEIQPIPEDDSGDSKQDLPRVRNVVVGKNTTGQGAGDSQYTFWYNYTFDIADCEEPYGVEMVEYL